MSRDLIRGIVSLAGDQVLAEVKRRAEAGEDSVKILEECLNGMNVVGEQFNKGEIALAELILSGEIFKKAFIFLEPSLSRIHTRHALDKVVVATLQGDIHDLGKSIFVTLLKARGFEIYDLGVDVDPKVVIQKVKEIRPRFVGFSALITPVLKVMRKTVEMLTNEGLKDDTKVLIGGGITTPQSMEYIGADFQTINAMEGLNYCIKMSSKTTFTTYEITCSTKG
jgi:methylmalonyl-CoA mutase cobalamin-binding domain/chain